MRIFLPGYRTVNVIRLEELMFRDFDAVYLNGLRAYRSIILEA